MTVKIEALIQSLGKPWQTIYNAGIITYKSPPKGTKTDPVLTLDMKKEGIFLSFDNNEEKSLGEISLELTAANQGDIFPNELPNPLKPSMSREWVHDTFGEPEKSNPPKVVMTMKVGWIERYSLKGGSVPTTITFYYDMDEIVEAVTFQPTSRLRW